ncbi:MAG TPA: hypothetical protein VHT91_10595 [Kofleriaceae bacterium]|jgi:hypothetical protein|nr:hypothetical protein [Kofleriaceae bacterium]
MRSLDHERTQLFNDLERNGRNVWDRACLTGGLSLGIASMAWWHGERPDPMAFCAGQAAKCPANAPFLTAFEHEAHAIVRIEQSERIFMSLSRGLTMDLVALETDLLLHPRYPILGFRFLFLDDREPFGFEAIRDIADPNIQDFVTAAVTNGTGWLHLHNSPSGVPRPGTAGRFSLSSAGRDGPASDLVRRKLLTAVRQAIQHLASIPRSQRSLEAASQHYLATVPFL